MAAAEEVFTNSVSFIIKKQIKTALKNIIHLDDINVIHGIKIFWSRRRHDRAFDLILDLKQTSGCNVQEVFQSKDNLLKLMNSLENDYCHIHFQNCKMANFDLKQIGIQFQKRSFASYVLKLMNDSGKEYGQLNQMGNKVAVIYPYINCNDRDSEIGLSLIELRSLLISDFVGRLLSFLGYNVNICSDSNELGFYKHFKSYCYKSDDCESNRKLCKARLAETVNGKEIFQILKVVELEHLVNDHAKTNVDICLFVTPENQYYRCNRTREIWEKNTLSSCHPSFIFIRHGLVVLRNNMDSSALFQNILDEIEKSSLHRFEELAVELNMSSEKDLIKCLVDLILKMDFLTRLSSHEIKVINIDAAVKSGSFVMYNYARICVLLDNFQQKVKQGLISTLPSFSEIEISLLNREEEWQLILLCAKYPDIIEEIWRELLEDSTLTCHKLINYVVEVSHCLSIYYNRINILADVSLHLQPTIFARIQLLTCVKQLMENIFSLLDVTPIQKM